MTKLGINADSWDNSGVDVRVAFFRIAFGGVLAYFFGELIFTGKGVHHYVDPIYLFRYPGFGWIPVLPDHLLMGVMYLGFGSALLFLVGAFFRFSSVLLSASFIYTFLLDISYWNNHYYFYALVSIIFIFTNAGNTFSVDAFFRPKKQRPNRGWELWLFRFIVGVVFFYGGVSKLSNPEWLNNTAVTSIFTSSFERLGIEVSNTQFSIITWTISIFGLVFDLLVPFALISARPWVRIVAILFYVPFNVMNALLLRIGTFPFALLGALTLYIHPKWLMGARPRPALVENIPSKNKLRRSVIWIFVIWQLVFPLRHWLIEGNMFWTSEGKLYGWFMMSGSIQVEAQNMYLIEYTDDEVLKASHHVELKNFLSTDQMRTLGHWPFLIPEFARFMRSEAELSGMQNVKVSADILISRNRRRKRHIVSHREDLASLKRNPWAHSPWILLYAKEGF